MASQNVESLLLQSSSSCLSSIAIADTYHSLFRHEIAISVIFRKGRKCVAVHDVDSETSEGISAEEEDDEDDVREYHMPA